MRLQSSPISDMAWIISALGGINTIYFPSSHVYEGGPSSLLEMICVSKLEMLKVRRLGHENRENERYPSILIKKSEYSSVFYLPDGAFQFLFLGFAQKIAYARASWLDQLL